MLPAVLPLGDFPDENSGSGGGKQGAGVKSQEAGARSQRSAWGDGNGKTEASEQPAGAKALDSVRGNPDLEAAALLAGWAAKTLRPTTAGSVRRKNAGASGDVAENPRDGKPGMTTNGPVSDAQGGEEAGLLTAHQPLPTSHLVDEGAPMGRTGIKA